MPDEYINAHSLNDFQRARSKAFIQRILAFMHPRKYDLLSLEYVKKMLSPKKEAYRGVHAVPLALIVGSEGRYNDFNREFLPRHDHLQPRWMNIDRLHLKEVILPPIQLYEVGGVYFVRDGNHRVSVARSQGVESIDAEIISLDSFIEITPQMDKNELKKAVISYEKERFEQKTEFSKLVPDNYDLNFSSTGRYNEVLFHIIEHKYYINFEFPDELPLSFAVHSWYENVFSPIVEIIRDNNLLSYFPDRTEGDLYVWISKQWSILKAQYGEEVEITTAANDVVESKGLKGFEKIRYFLKKLGNDNQLDSSDS